MSAFLSPAALVPVTGIGLIILFVFMAAFIISLLRARSAAKQEAGGPTTTSQASRMGIGVQMLAFFWASFGPIKIEQNGLDRALIVEAVAIFLLAGATVYLFTAARTALAKNWSFVARTRADHQLVQSGPYRYVRHPIYLCLLLWMIAMALAMGHPQRLVIAIPVYIIGTLWRVSEEEKLLRAMFGADFDAYAARVKRFIPGLL